MIDKGKPAIMVVDDDATNIKLLQNTLGPLYRVIIAKSGRKALELAERHQPQLILLDVMMPEMDGYEVCRRLKAGPAASIPVIFVSALHNVNEEEAGFDIGAVDYIAKPIRPSIVLRRVALHISLVKVDEMNALARSAIQMLGEAGHYNDNDMGAHIWRMAAYTRAIAQAAGWSSERAAMLELAAPLHDTGKVGIPDSILKAPRKLTSDEWQIMMSHSQIGFNILSVSENPVFQLAAEIALRHHEKWDSSGYPGQLLGKEIPESAQIVAIADVFDALTTKRPYKEPWKITDAITEIKELSGSHFDPLLVDVFIKITPQIIRIKSDWDVKEGLLAGNMRHVG